MRFSMMRGEGLSDRPFPFEPPTLAAKDNPMRFFRNFRTLAPALTVAMLVPAAVAQYDSMNMRLYSQLTPQDMGGTRGNDCWGYVSPSGREYAISGLYERTAFVEVTDPVNPVLIHSEPHAPGVTGDMKIYQHYAYSAGDRYSLQVFDLSNIDNGNVTKVNELGFRAHNFALNEESGFAYMSASSWDSGLTALDLSDPVNPTVAGQINATGGHVHDAQIVSYTSGPYAGREIAFCPSGYWRFDIIDVTNKSGMFLMGSLIYPGLNYCHQGWLSADRQYFYLDDELDELNGYVNTTRTLVIDVSDLSNPTLVNEFTTGMTSIDHNLYVFDGFLFEANYTSGAHIFDLRSDPVDPTYVGWFDSYPENNAVEFEGAWSIYPYFPSGTLVLNDRSHGLFLLDTTEARGERIALATTPLVSGQQATLTATDAIPNSRVYFLYSLDRRGVDMGQPAGHLPQPRSARGHWERDGRQRWSGLLLAPCARQCAGAHHLAPVRPSRQDFECPRGSRAITHRYAWAPYPASPYFSPAL